METIIKSKFHPGQRVYVIEDNKIQLLPIASIAIKVFSNGNYSIEYEFADYSQRNYNRRLRSESECFETPESFAEQIRRTLDPHLSADQHAEAILNQALKIK